MKRKILFYVLLIALFLVLVYWFYVAYNIEIEIINNLKIQNDELIIKIEENQKAIDSTNLVIKRQEDIIFQREMSYDSLKNLKLEIQSEIKKGMIESKDLSEAAERLKENIRLEKERMN